ncbi:hypothetical protein FOIG_14245 [Fusarium odoratissimum NRRL 54006]|uniref:Alpha-L-rhamnosidase n=2 Tax=Fusarium oxysporum species complex TaxID=171631 RepID=X0J8T5_FUSO5|nr:uncharacterized protein FOIG_14245 [Fusarium odoratissimum NRRL 54006]EXL92761.1 hypothetical protein FOIG_14245 [Fusarium odoratissimum NRRL 54006]
MTTWPSVGESRSLKSHLSTTKGPWRLPKPVLAYHGDLNVMQENWKPSACNIQMSRGAGIELRIHSFNTSRSRYLAWSGDTLESKEETCKARLYITALGLYGAEINGERVEDHVLAPGFQSFKHLHVYDTYDATEPVSRGRNAIGILVSEGWYAGRLFGHIEKRDFRNLCGFRIGAMCLLKVTLSDRTNVHIPSDKTWSSSFGPLSDSQIYNGDLRLRKESVMTGWSMASFDNGDWLSVEELPPLTATLVPSDGPPVRKLKELQPKETFQTVSGKVIVDFGQNFAGCARITVSGPSGTDIILRNAEVLENGETETKPPRTTDVPARKFENLDLHFTASAMLRLTTGP